MLAIEYHVHIWQVWPQLICCDTCQIWMGFKECNRYFCQIENFASGEIDERNFSNPHPWPCDNPSLWNTRRCRDDLCIFNVTHISAEFCQLSLRMICNKNQRKLTELFHPLCSDIISDQEILIWFETNTTFSFHILEISTSMKMCRKYEYANMGFYLSWRYEIYGELLSILQHLKFPFELFWAGVYIAVITAKLRHTSRLWHSLAMINRKRRVKPDMPHRLFCWVFVYFTSYYELFCVFYS